MSTWIPHGFAHGVPGCSRVFQVPRIPAGCPFWSFSSASPIRRCRIDWNGFATKNQMQLHKQQKQMASVANTQPVRLVVTRSRVAVQFGTQQLGAPPICFTGYNSTVGVGVPPSQNSHWKLVHLVQTYIYI